MTTTTLAPATRDARSLLTPAAFQGVTATVSIANPDVGLVMAERIVEEALKFVAAAARGWDGPLRPSRVVDEGWHALILHTVVYERLCANLGQFVHHVPEPPATKVHNEDTVDRVLAAIRAAGFEPDTYLWTRDAQQAVLVSADCMHSECNDDNGGGACTAPQ
ncbi:hypothetical protein LG634_24525 [Streptomyces bambusae]|uniref:glycine-rich domain-containing protein n=1 Tax=Streptomyces bambusae TaxID=1550616 RepID=UPI001CFE4DFE|nr:hypothetical protein [Streptomyces bambusae]MCB5167980.1 hypothetical protein [Streptomyces bambusae]